MLAFCSRKVQPTEFFPSVTAVLTAKLVTDYCLGHCVPKFKVQKTYRALSEGDSRNLGADQEKRYDHEVAAAHTSFIWVLL